MSIAPMTSAPFHATVSRPPIPSAPPSAGEQEQQGDEREILEQQHGEGGAADRALGARDRDDQRGRRHGERQPEHDRGGNAVARRDQADADQQRAADQFGGADPEHLAPHRPQALEAQLEPDREQQQDDPEFGERRDALGIGDRHRLEPRRLLGQRAERERAGDDPDQDEADDRADLRAARTPG